MLATFSLKMVRSNLKPPSFLLGLCHFSICLLSWPCLGAIWARFGKGWGSILEVFDSHFSILFVICLNHFYILQVSFFDPLGKLTALLGKLMENPRLLLENLFSMYVGHGSGWAGGVTRSVKNLT